MAASLIPDGLPESYSFVREQIAMVGDHDPREILAETPELLEALVAAHATEMFSSEAVVGKWTPAEVLGHLSDAEWIFGIRMRAIFCEDRPALACIDQDDWVLRQQHRHRDPRAIVSAFRATRSVNCLFWQELPRDQMHRAGRHADAGVDYSLNLLLHLHAGHDLVHLRQLVETLELIASTSAL